MSPIIQAITISILLPLLGTTFGAAGVFFLRREISAALRRALQGFAAGIMAAASVWSLLLPALERSASLGRWAFLPAAAGFWAGVLFLCLLDRAAPCLCPGIPAGHTGALVLAVTIHNLPEGMAVGAACAGLRAGSGGLTAAGTLMLALGIAIQNIPEGAIVSLPLRAEGMSRRRAFLCGFASGVVEPLGAALTLLLAALVVPALPAFLSFAAGAMFCVVIEELIPDMCRGGGSGTLAFTAGFTLMMALDVALG